MKQRIWIQSVLLVACGILLGVGVDRGWHHTQVQSALNFDPNATWPE